MLKKNLQQFLSLAWSSNYILKQVLTQKWGFGNWMNLDRGGATTGRVCYQQGYSAELCLVFIQKYNFNIHKYIVNGCCS